MRTIDCKAYDVKIRSLAIFPMQVSVLARRVIASIICAQVGVNCGVHFMTPFTPAKLMRSAPNPCESEVPGLPAQSKDYQCDMHIKCVWEWMYLMFLLQYWYDTIMVYDLSRPVQKESKLIYKFVFYRVNVMLNPHSLHIQLHEIMDFTLWQHYYKERTQPKECMAYLETHKNTIAGLDQLRNWLKNYYLVEAMEEWKFPQWLPGYDTFSTIIWGSEAGEWGPLLPEEWRTFTSPVHTRICPFNCQYDDRGPAPPW